MNPFDPNGPFYAGFQHMLRSELQTCLGGGMLQRGLGNREALPEEIGGKCGNSGSGEVPDGTPVTVLNVVRKNAPVQGCGGMATVHVSVEDVTGTESGLRAGVNAGLFLEVNWQSGTGGGSCEVDATQGSMFVLGGANVVSVKAFQRSTVGGEALSVWATKRVEATVHWDGSVEARGAFMTLPSQLLAVDTESAFQRIPRQAMTMIALSQQHLALPLLVAEFSNSDDAGGAAIRYRTISPFVNGTPIVAGVEFVRFISPAIMTVIPMFELWI